MQLLLQGQHTLLLDAFQTTSMALPFTPATPEQAAQSIARKMSLVRQGLISKGEYLVDPTITSKVAWEPHGSGHRLVLLPPPSRSVVSREATPFPDSPDSETPIANPFDTSPPMPNNTPDNSSQPVADMSTDTTNTTVPAVLAIVAQLVPGQSWLYPDARWTGPTVYVRKFTDAKLLCTGCAATHPRFTNDYVTAIGNLNEIMGKIRDSRNDRNTVVSGPADHIRVRHPLFTVCLLSWLSIFPSC